ncbi:MAG: hypothetical protein ACI8W3_002685 [Myxococcota bacterium]
MIGGADLTVAYAALFIWVFVTLGFFLFLRPPVAAATGFLAGTMFLPAAVRFNPLIFPVLGKEEITSMCVLVATLVFASQQLRRAQLGSGPEIMIGIAMIGSVLNVFTNMDAVRIGAVDVPGTTITDFGSNIIQLALRWGIPFFIGRAMFTRSRDGRSLLKVFTVAGLIYTLPILIELQISPQLHKFLYGYHQHSFAQTLRPGGYRPMVFMVHGLNLTLFLVMTMTAATALWRIKRMQLGASLGPAAVFVGYGPAAGVLAVILLACKSTGSILYGLMIAPLVMFVSPNLQLRVACMLAIVVFTYPLLRSVDALPYDAAIEMALEYSGPKRARSLSSRLYTEKSMIERIAERPILGWASAGRSAIRDPYTGEMTTVYDGFWVIVLAERGIVGYSMIFGMLLWPIFTAARARSKIRSRHDRVVLAALSLMIAIHVFDFLPNSPVEGYLTLMSGALAGLVPGILREQRHKDRQADESREPLRGNDQARIASLLGPR